jgi:hypothetical protein
MPKPARPRRRRIEIVIRVAAAAAALALALVPVARLRGLEARREQMAAWLAAAGVPVPRELANEPDPGRAVLRAARAVLNAELDPARHPVLPPAEAERELAASAARLEEAARLAGEVFAERPAAWDAAMILGTSRYLARSWSRDTHLFTEAPLWERPIEAAIALAPGRPDASRLLAGAYLDLWPALSPRKRERERQLLARVLSDPPSFSSLIPRWVAVAPSREEAFAVVPPTPEAWARVQQIYADHFDWQGFCAARARWDLALRTRLSTRLVQAGRRRAIGDDGSARELFLEVAAEARPERRYLAFLTRALEGCPPGPIDRRTAERLEKHLAWSLESCLFDRCPLPTRLLLRLDGFCRDLDPRGDAMVALVTGDLQRAEALERAFATPWDEDWVPYRLLKAKVLAESGRKQEVEEALSGLPPAWRARPGYWHVRAEIARAVGDPAAQGVAARELAQRAASAWPASAWDFHGGVPRLELLAAAGASGLALAVDVAPPRGAAAEVRLDRVVLGTFPIRAGAPLVVSAAIAPGWHVLEFESIAGGSALPGAVRLAFGAGGL